MEAGGRWAGNLQGPRFGRRRLPAHRCRVLPSVPALPVAWRDAIGQAR